MNTHDQLLVTLRFVLELLTADLNYADRKDALAIAVNAIREAIAKESSSVASEVAAIIGAILENPNTIDDETRARLATWVCANQTPTPKPKQGLTP